MAVKQIKVDALSLAGGVVSIEVSGRVPSRGSLALYKLHLRGSSYQDIAVAKSLPVEKVRRLIRSAERYVLANAMIDVLKLKVQQHIELQSMIDEAKGAWKKSKGIKKKTVRKYDQLGTMTEESETIEQGGGDIEYLNAAAKFMKEQREIWPGANAPKAQAITNADGTGDAKLLVETWQYRIKQMPAEKRALLFDVIEGVAVKPESD